MKILMFDTETTGLRPGQICQLSYIVIDNSTKPYDVYGKNFFFSVDYMEESAEQIHGFSKELLEELSGGVTFEECYHEFIEDFLIVILFQKERPIPPILPKRHGSV